MRTYSIAALLILAIPSFVTGIAQPTTTPPPATPDNEVKPIYVGERIQIPEQSIEINPTSLKDPELTSCFLLLGDTIEVRAIGKGESILLKFIDTKDDQATRDEHSGCEVGKPFFMERKQYLELREKYNELRNLEGRRDSGPFLGKPFTLPLCITHGGGFL